MSSERPIFERISRAPVLKEGAWVLAGQIAAALGGLVSVRILTQLAPVSVYGEVALLLGVLALDKQVFLAPVTSTQLRFHPGYRWQGLADWFTVRIARRAWGSTAVFIARSVWISLRGASPEVGTGRRRSSQGPRLSSASASGEANPPAGLA